MRVTRWAPATRSPLGLIVQVRVGSRSGLAEDGRWRAGSGRRASQGPALLAEQRGAGPARRLPELAHDARRIADDDREAWNILGYHGARTHHRSFPDREAGEDHGAGSNRCAAANR